MYTQAICTKSLETFFQIASKLFQNDVYIEAKSELHHKQIEK